MRVALVVLLIVLEGCGPTPSPPASVQRASGTAPAATQAADATLTADPAASRGTFRFDVENNASVGVVVSVASDTAVVMPGFAPGQRGTISIPLLNPGSGIAVEIERPPCRLLARGMYPSGASFTLLVTDGPAGTVRLSTRAATFATPVPLPSNSLVGCGG
jgi:hypothetical protein